MEALMFALLTKSRVLINAEHNYYDFDRLAHGLYVEEEFYHLKRMLALNDQIINPNLVKSLIVDVDNREVKTLFKHYKIKNNIVKYDKLVVFDDENVRGLEDSSVKRLYRVIDNFKLGVRKEIIFRKKDILIKTGQEFPAYLFLRRAIRKKGSGIYCTNACISFLNKKQVHAPEYDMRWIRPYVLDITNYMYNEMIKNVRGTKPDCFRKVNLMHREVQNILPNFADTENEKFISTTEQKALIRKKFYEALCERDPFEPLNLLYETTNKVLRFRDWCDSKYRLVREKSPECLLQLQQGSSEDKVTSDSLSGDSSDIRETD